MIPRRTLLTTLGSGLLVPITGCQGDFPSSKRLGMHVHSVERKGEEWTLEVTVFNDTTVDSHSADFHDVELFVYSPKRELLRAEPVGTVPYTQGINEGVRLTTTCDRTPYLLALRAKESPCDEETRIQFRYYVGDGFWEPDYRNCDEGLPPKRRDGEPTTIGTPSEDSE